MTQALTASTFDELSGLLDSLRLVMFVHESDRHDPLVLEIEGMGWEVEVDEYMPPRKVFLRSCDYLTVGDLDTKTFYAGANQFNTRPLEIRRG